MKTACLLLSTFALVGCLGDPCDDAWEPDFKRGFVCADSPDRCVQIGERLDRKLQFVAKLATVEANGKPVSASTLKHRARCVADFIAERGAVGLAVAPDNMTVTATTTFRRIVPAMEFNVVASFTSMCGTQGGCDVCATLTANECNADAFCTEFQSCPL